MPKKVITRHSVRFVIFFVLVAIATVCYAAFITDASNSKTTLTLTEIAARNQQILETEINKNLSDISDLAATINNMGYDTEEEIIEYLTYKKTRRSYHRLGIADTSGNSLMTDGKRVNISERDYFQCAMSGDTSIYDTITDFVDDTLSIAVSTPIYFDGEIKYVLFATYTLDNYIELLATPSFDGAGYSYVISRSGDCIVGSSNENSYGEYFNNFFNEMSNASRKNDKAVLKMQSDMEAGESGFIKMYNIIPKYVYYTPININNWYLLTVIPQNIITKYTNRVLLSGYIFIVFFIIVFLLLMRSISYIQEKSRKELERMAYVDELTGGMSYAKFKVEAEKLLKKNTDEKYALVNLDVNNFQYVNDIFGYDEGDRALKYLRSAIEETLTEEEICSRIFDDHFAFIMEYLNTAQVTEKMNLLFSKIKAYQPADGIYNMIVSAGVYPIDDISMDIDSMLNRARIPQKRIKGHSSKSTFAVYDPELRKLLIQEKEIENAFDSAIANKEFKVYYQPKFNIDKNCFDGAEALVRWQKKDGTLVSPGAFIPIFEKNGDIVRLDKYVLEETCASIREWLDKGYKVSPISVNVSLLQLMDENFVNDHVDTVRKYNIPLNLIEVEFTESIMAENEELVISLANQLKEHGIKVLLDDFGSGYSSLNMLHALPINIVKMDKHFIDNLETDNKSRAIVSGAINLSHTLDMNVTAEGVETKEQYDCIAEMGCDYIQGFYCAKPMPKSDYEEIVKGQK